MSLPESNYVLIGTLADFLSKRTKKKITDTEILDYAIQGLLTIYYYLDSETVLSDTITISEKQPDVPVTLGKKISFEHLLHSEAHAEPSPRFLQVSDKETLRMLHYNSTAYFDNQGPPYLCTFVDDEGRQWDAVKKANLREIMERTSTNTRQTIWIPVRVPLSKSNLYVRRSEANNFVERHGGNAEKKVPLSSRERENLFETIGVLLRLYVSASNSNLLGSSESPNIKQVTTNILDHLSERGIAETGMAERTLHKRLSEAKELLEALQ